MQVGEMKWMCFLLLEGLTPPTTTTTTTTTTTPPPPPSVYFDTLIKLHFLLFAAVIV